MSEKLLGGRARAAVLDALGLARDNALSGYTIAKLFRLGLNETYVILKELESTGIVEVIQGKRRYYRLRNGDASTKFIEAVRALDKAGEPDDPLLSTIRDRLSLGKYYVSLPYALRITYDVFYMPGFLLLVVEDEATFEKTQRIRENFKDTKFIVKKSSLRGREYYFDESLRVALASNEQALADGLNWYSDIRDTEIIRVLLAYPGRFDLEKLATILESIGKKRARTILERRKAVYGSGPPLEIFGDTMRRSVDPIISDLRQEWKSILLPNRA